MNIQPAYAGTATGAISAANVANDSLSGMGHLDVSMRGDWHVRMNASHATGFVGGAGRVLIHNLAAEEKRELILLLPAALADRPGRLEITDVKICSVKPGMSAQAGEALAFRNEGAKAVVTLSPLWLNEWMYIDITWTGAFAPGGESFPGGQVPIGDFHPQIAIPAMSDTGQPGLAPLTSRYDVELGTDLGATVRLEEAAAESGAPISKPSEDGTMTMHEFKSYGSSRIEAFVVPPGAVG
jgi:hypothetical protein